MQENCMLVLFKRSIVKTRKKSISLYLQDKTNHNSAITPIIFMSQSYKNKVKFLNQKKIMT